MYNLYAKYKSFIAYTVFGVLTTCINIAAYYVFSRFLYMDTVLSNVAAWITGVSFAYATNRKWVFESRACRIDELVKEMMSFYGCRLLTGLLDIGIMYLFVDLFGMPDMIIKVISNIVVIMLNYIASKLIIFKSK